MLEYHENPTGVDLSGWWFRSKNKPGVGPFLTSKNAAAWGAIEMCLRAYNHLHNEKISIEDIYYLLGWMDLDITPEIHARYLIQLGSLIRDDEILENARALIEQLDPEQENLLDALIHMCCLVEEKNLKCLKDRPIAKTPQT